MTEATWTHIAHVLFLFQSPKTYLFKVTVDFPVLKSNEVYLAPGSLHSAITNHLIMEMHSEKYSVMFFLYEHPRVTIPELRQGGSIPPCDLLIQPGDVTNTTYGRLLVD